MIILYSNVLLHSVEITMIKKVLLKKGQKVHLVQSWLRARLLILLQLLSELK